MAKVSDFYPREGDFAELLADAQMAASTEWEVQFTGDMAGRFDQYEGGMFISAEQVGQLERIAANPQE